MILRKPYAFLIKYFQKINILLLILVSYVFYKNLKIYQFAKTYLATGIYNSSIDPISNYANTYVYLAFIFIIVISFILIYLLRHKDKPYASYVFVLVSNVTAFAFFLYTSHYFTYTVTEGYNLVAIRVVRDLLFISTLPYYPMIFILLIRSIGIDLKNFGFQEDKEFAEINESDREEVEVQVAFNKDRLIRKIKNKLRYLKYFFLEHKFSLTIVFVLILFIFGYNFYNYFYVENKVYSMNEPFDSNYYRITVKNTYLTDKDYAGNIVSETGKFFIIAQVQIQNLLSSSRDFDIEKMLLFIDQDYYVPTTKYNVHFSDMGNTYENKSIKPKETVTYSLIYEVKKPDSKANFLLKYQDVLAKDGKLIGVKMKVLDISTFKTKGNFTYPEQAIIPINEETSMTFSFDKMDITESSTYRYQSCLPDSCPIYEKTITAPSGYKILYLRGNFGSNTTQEYLDFLKKYGKIRYSKDGKTYQSNIKFAVTGAYQGRHIYISIPDSIADADSISFVFTIRTYQYFYKLKGE